jgi:predicted lysophospholipase L1 biosynthesis ABC-type transport system permease subunit
MRTAIGLLVGWLLAALLVLGMDGRLLAFLAGAVPVSLLVLGVGSLVRQQLAPSPYNRPSVPARYRVADDLRQPLADVVAVAEQEAITAPPVRR